MLQGSVVLLSSYTLLAVWSALCYPSVDSLTMLKLNCCQKQSIIDLHLLITAFLKIALYLPVDSSSFSLWTLWTTGGNGGIRCERSINKYKKQQTCSICLSVNRSALLCFITLDGVAPAHTHTKSTRLT